MKRQVVLLASAVLPLAAAGGCVKRTLSINTQPPAALVYLNDQEVGRTPVSVPFTWYGDYDIIIRKEGYQTLQTHKRIHPPWYQVPPFDFMAEVLSPVTYHDRHELEYALEPRQYPTTQQLLEQASSFRDRTLHGQE